MVRYLPVLPLPMICLASNKRHIENVTTDPIYLGITDNSPRTPSALYIKEISRILEKLAKTIFGH